MTGTFVRRDTSLKIPRPAVAVLLVAAILLPLLGQPYLIQVLTNSLLYAMLALSLTLVAGTVGLVSIGHAALLALGAYSSALVTTSGLPVALGLLVAGIVAMLVGTAVLYPSFRLRGHYVAIATLAIGEIVGLVILNWTSLTNGPMGIVGIPPLSFFGYDLFSVNAVYWFVLALVTAFALLQTRLLSSHLGRTWRSIREDTIAAETYGVNADRYKALAFGVGGFVAGISGGISAHLFSFINFDSFNFQVSVLALTIVILGGLGNVLGAVIGAVLVVGLPELFRMTAEYRVLIYGLSLLLLIRFRPQGLLGTA